MKFWLIALGVCLLLAVFWVVFKEEDNQILPINKNLTVLAFGDSLVQGVGASEGQDFVSVLASSLGINIINAGKSGDTTQAALARLEAEVLNKNPDVVILLLGGNDGLRRVPEEQTFENLGKIIDALRQNQAEVLLLGVRGSSLLGDSFKDNFKKLAKEKQVALVENVMDGVFGHRELMSDAIHPSDAGYLKIAGKVEPALRKLLEK